MSDGPHEIQGVPRNNYTQWLEKLPQLKQEERTSYVVAHVIESVAEKLLKEDHFFHTEMTAPKSRPSLRSKSSGSVWFKVILPST